MKTRGVSRCTLAVLADFTFAVGTAVIDVVGGQLTSNVTVVIRGDTMVIDAAGTFLIPGLWDMHAHVQGSGEPCSSSMSRMG